MSSRDAKRPTPWDWLELAALCIGGLGGSYALATIFAAEDRFGIMVVASITALVLVAASIFGDEDDDDD